MQQWSPLTNITALNLWGYRARVYSLASNPRLCITEYPPAIFRIIPAPREGLDVKLGIQTLGRQPERHESTSAIVTFAEAQCGCENGSHTV